MRYWIITAYAVIAILVGIWNDALDQRFGVDPNASNSWLLTTLVSAAWPISVPIAMAAIASGGWGRWQKLK